MVHWQTIRISMQAKGASKGRISLQTHFQSLPSQNQVPKGGSQAGRLAYIYMPIDQPARYTTSACNFSGSGSRFARPSLLLAGYASSPFRMAHPSSNILLDILYAIGQNMFRILLQAPARCRQSGDLEAVREQQGVQGQQLATRTFFIKQGPPASEAFKLK